MCYILVIHYFTHLVVRLRNGMFYIRLQTTNTHDNTPHLSTTSSRSIGVPFVLTYTPSIRQILPPLKITLPSTEEAQVDPHFPLLLGKRLNPLLSVRRGSNHRDLVAPSALS